MKVCIIGDGLVSLALANVLIRKNLPVDIVFDGNLKKYDKSRKNMNLQCSTNHKQCLHVGRKRKTSTRMARSSATPYRITSTSIFTVLGGVVERAGLGV